MKTFFSKFLLVVLVLSASVVFLSNSALAVDPPWFTFDGTFSYDAENYALTTTITNITQISYIDGTFTGPAFMGGISDDPLCPVPGTCGKILLGSDNGSGGGVIYNGGADSLSFGSAAGGTGNMSFSIFNGSDTYLTATMTGFQVTYDETFGTRLNPGFDAMHITNISTNPGAPDSKFINDVESLNNPVGNLFLDFNFASGANDFSEDASGTFLGGKFAVTVAPEPVSSVLFLAGGTVLAFRRYKRKAFYRS